MPQPFHLTTWLRHHPLTVLLLAATVCVDALAINLSRYGDRLSWAIPLGLASGQVGFLALCCGSRRISILGSLLFILGVGLGFVVIDTPSNQVLYATTFGLIIAIIMIVEWTRGLLKSRRYSLREIVNVTTFAAVVAAYLQFGWFEIEIIYLAFASALLALIAMEAYVRKSPWRLPALALSLLIACAGSWLFSSWEASGEYFLIFLVQAVFYAIWFEVLRAERIWWFTGNDMEINSSAEPG